MTAKQFTVSALVTTLALGAAATPSLARDMRGDGQERGFIYLLKTSDANKDGKITEEEVAAFQNGRFEEIDVNSDGVITPGEFSDYRKAKRQAFRDANPRPDGKMAANGEQPGKPGPNGKMAANGEQPGRPGPNGKMAANGEQPGRPGPNGKMAANGEQPGRPGPNGKMAANGEQPGRPGPNGKMAANGEQPGRPGPGDRMANGDRGPDGRGHGMPDHMAMNGDGPQHRMGGKDGQWHGKQDHNWGDRPGNAGRIFFVRADTDRSGQVSQQEFSDLAARMFARMDHNGDMVITIDDLPARPPMR